MANSMFLNKQRHFFRKTKSLTILLETPSIDVIRNYTAYCIDFFSQSKFKFIDEVVVLVCLCSHIQLLLQRFAHIELLLQKMQFLSFELSTEN